MTLGNKTAKILTKIANRVILNITDIIYKGRSKMKLNTKKLIVFILISLSAVLIIGMVVYFSFLRSTIIFQEMQLSRLLKLDTLTSKYEIFSESVTVFDNQIFPVLIFSISNTDIKINESISDGIFVGDTSGILGCSIIISPTPSLINNIFNNNKNVPIRLEIEGTRFINKSIIETEIYLDTKYNLFPKINYNYALLENNLQPSLENITFRIYCNDKLFKEYFETIQIRGINEVPFLLLSDYGEIIDFSWLFVSFVNEDNPIIDQILKEALEVGIIEVSNGTRSKKNSFFGYQGSENDLVNQVFAIWNVFQRRGIKYSSITTTSSTSKKVVSQYVRTFTDTINSNQANCVDGSILFASILRKIGIDPFLVLLPGHMIVGFWKDNNHSGWIAIETTILGDENINNYIEDKTFLLGGFAWLFGISKNEISRNEFLYAIDIGRESINNNINEFNDINNKEYQILDILTARSSGINNINK
jgi:hypothetical protein